MAWNQILESHTHSDTFDMDNASRSPLTEYRIIVVEGVDAEKFLQGQCTCDFTNLKDDNFIMGAHCTPKGRMQSSFIAARLANENTIGLRVHASIAQSALEALKKYAVFSKATLNIAEDYYLVGITGNNIAQQLEKISPALATKINANTSQENEWARSATRDQNIIALYHTPEQVELWCKNSDSLSNINQRLEDTPLQSSDNLWQLFNIHNGIGNVQGETLGALLPQEINFQYTNGVSFKKGCYTGQEIVARLHYRGQMKKHMYRATIETTQSPQAGAAIYDKDSPEKARGSIIITAKSSNNTYDALVLCDDTLYEQEAHLKQEDFLAKIQWQALPYAIS